jgi:hypothetical protein
LFIVLPVIVAVPSAIAVISPDCDTVAIPSSFEEKETVLFVVLLGRTVAVIVDLSPISSDNVVSLNVTSSGETTPPAL